MTGFEDRLGLLPYRNLGWPKPIPENNWGNQNCSGSQGHAYDICIYSRVSCCYTSLPLDLLIPRFCHHTNLPRDQMPVRGKPNRAGHRMEAWRYLEPWPRPCQVGILKDDTHLTTLSIQKSLLFTGISCLGGLRGRILASIRIRLLTQNGVPKFWANWSQAAPVAKKHFESNRKSSNCSFT